jgi:hypothetical protein
MVEGSIGIKDLAPLSKICITMLNIDIDHFFLLRLGFLIVFL